MSVSLMERPIVKEKDVELLPDLNLYDKVIVSYSAGKDSTGCLIWALEQGISLEKLVLWHQEVDGFGQTQRVMMDWPVTHAYVQAVGDYFGIPVSFQWRSGGILGEMERQDSLTGDVYYMDPGKEPVCLSTTRGKRTTRMMWPAMSPDLTRRWCSAYAKIDVFRRALSNHPDFQGTSKDPMKVLVLTGERREESANRAKYNKVELHPCNTNSRLVHAIRPVIDMKEADIWSMYERYKLRPHPCYQIGFSRCSCMACIFSTSDLWRILQEIAPDRFQRLVDQEEKMQHTIDQKMPLLQKAANGSLGRMPLSDPRLGEWIALALGTEFSTADLIMDPWELPAGAFMGAAGGSL